MQRSQKRFLFLNAGHFLDHYFMLIFATAAALRLSQEWGISYADLIPYATPGFIAFGVCAIPAGWLADKWSREGMIAVFFVGIGLSSMLTGLANSPFQIMLSLIALGAFAAIYHPVGLALVVEGRSRTGMPLAINGIFGNMGVASAALLTGFLIDTSGWRNAFIVSGAVSVVVGILFVLFVRSGQPQTAAHTSASAAAASVSSPPIPTSMMLRIFAVVLFTTALGGLIFQSTTFALPKVFEERLGDLASSATLIGWYAFLVFSVAAFAQLLVGYLVDSQPLRVVFSCVALLQALFFGLMVQLEGMAALLTAIAFMLAVFGQIPINDVLVGRIVQSEWRSRAFGIRYVVTFSVMASAIPLVAWIHEHWGFDTLFAVLSAAATLILLAVLTLPAHESVLQRHSTSPTS